MSAICEIDLQMIERFLYSFRYIRSSLFRYRYS